jgi:hypothetical protein
VAFEDPNKGLRLHDPALVVKPGPGTGGGPLLEFRGYRFWDRPISIVGFPLQAVVELLPEQVRLFGEHMRLAGEGAGKGLERGFVIPCLDLSIMIDHG